MKSKTDTPLPYPECENCKEIGDCPHPDCEDNGFGSVMPPDSCPKPMKIMADTFKKRKIKNSKYEGC
jgi:hypothetical protein